MKSEWVNERGHPTKQFKVPMQECPNCGEFKFMTCRWIEHDLKNTITFGLLGEKRVKKRKYCKNCGYKEEVENGE